MSQRVSYQLRNPSNPDEIYGEAFESEEDAKARAQQLADFYGHSIQVCRLAFGRFLRESWSVEPGPTAPTPLLDRKSTTRTSLGKE